MKRICLFLFLVLFGTWPFSSTFLYITIIKNQHVSPSLLLNKLTNQDKKDLIRGVASLVLSGFSTAFYLYMTDQDSWDAKYAATEMLKRAARNYTIIKDKDIPYNKFDYLIESLFSIFPYISNNNRRRLTEGGSLLIASTSAMYGFKKLALIVKSLRTRQVNIK